MNGRDSGSYRPPPRKHREWLFCIPMQIGPATPYARSLKKWFLGILLLQAILCVTRLVLLVDISGGLWMGFTIAVGIFAYKENMNVTYICSWGMLCVINCVFDIIGFIVPTRISTVSYNAGETLVLICIPFMYFIGAIFARHVYRDYATSENIKVNDMGMDPFGSLLKRANPAEDRGGPHAAWEKDEERGGYGGAGDDRGRSNQRYSDRDDRYTDRRQDDRYDDRYDDRDRGRDRYDDRDRGRGGGYDDRDRGKSPDGEMSWIDKAGAAFGASAFKGASTAAKTEASSAMGRGRDYGMDQYDNRRDDARRAGDYGRDQYDRRRDQADRYADEYDARRGRY